jgi:hypothetical protein
MIMSVFELKHIQFCYSVINNDTVRILWQQDCILLTQTGTR